MHLNNIILDIIILIIILSRLENPVIHYGGFIICRYITHCMLCSYIHTHYPPYIYSDQFCINIALILIINTIIIYLGGIRCLD